MAQIDLEADRRRDEHRSECAAAIERIRARGETVAVIAALTNVSVTEVRSHLKAARTQRDAYAGDVATRAAQSLGGAGGGEESPQKVVGIGA